MRIASPSDTPPTAHLEHRSDAGPGPRLAEPRATGVAEPSRRRVLGLLAAASVAALVATSVAGDASAGPTADEIAVRVQKFYDTTKTYKADFAQTYTIKAQNSKKESKGKVTFEKPGKMSWAYAMPNGNRVVSDGTTIRVYERENEQMFETPVKGSQYPAALSFLMGEGQLQKDFTFRLLDATQMRFEAGYVLEATPKEATPAYQKMLLYVDAATSQVRRALVLDAQGNRNRFDFSNPVVNQPVPKGEFDFTPPPGTKVIKP